MQDFYKLKAGSVGVWTASLELPTDALSDLRRLLSGDELERADRFHFDRDRLRYIAARVLLRTLLGRYLDCGPTSIRFDYGRHGKPALVSPSAQIELFFNLSHTHDFAIYAVTALGPIGVDVERVRADFPIEEIIPQFCLPSEADALRRLPAPLRNERALALWTRKEAYCKAQGLGLSLDPRRIDALSGIEDGASVFHLSVDGVIDRTLSVQDLGVSPGYIATLAVFGRPSEVTVRPLTLP